MKIIEAMVICFGFDSLSSINISNLLVESDDCLEVIKLLNDVVIDLYEVSFFIEEAKDRGRKLEIISFFHVCRSHNVLTHCVVHKGLEDQESSILSTPKSEWFTLIISRDTIV